MAAAPSLNESPSDSFTSRSAGTTFISAYEAGTPVHATRSPALMSATPGPTAVTVPAPSCPTVSGSGRLVLAGAEVHVDVVDAARPELHDRLAGAGGRIGNILVLQGFGTPGRMDANRRHGRLGLRSRYCWNVIPCAKHSLVTMVPVPFRPVGASRCLSGLSGAPAWLRRRSSAGFAGATDSWGEASEGGRSPPPSFLAVPLRTLSRTRLAP